MALKKRLPKLPPAEKPQSIVLPLILFIIGLFAMYIIVHNIGTALTAGNDVMAHLKNQDNHPH